MSESFCFFFSNSYTEAIIEWDDNLIDQGIKCLIICLKFVNYDYNI